jgi:hypothetical protein
MCSQILAGPANSSLLRNLVSEKLFQRPAMSLDRGRTILRTDGPVCVDVVRHSLAYTDAIGDLLERVTPSVVWPKPPIPSASQRQPLGCGRDCKPDSAAAARKRVTGPLLPRVRQEMPLAHGFKIVE